MGGRSVHTSDVSSFSIRTNLQVLKESESEYIKNVGMGDAGEEHIFPHFYFQNVLLLGYS